MYSGEKTFGFIQLRRFFDLINTRFLTATVSKLPRVRRDHKPSSLHECAFDAMLSGMALRLWLQTLGKTPSRSFQVMWPLPCTHLKRQSS